MMNNIRAAIELLPELNNDLRCLTTNGAPTRKIAVIIAALEELKGMAVVPREPTPDMYIRGGIVISEHLKDAETLVDVAAPCYRAMIAEGEKQK